jgi:hypothetical protein
MVMGDSDDYQDNYEDCWSMYVHLHIHLKCIVYFFIKIL